MNQDRKKLILLAIGTLLLLTTVGLYGYLMVKNDKVSTGGIIAFIIPILLIVFMAFFIKRRYIDLKKGMPLEDERSRKVTTRAAAMTFYASLYWLLFISFFEDFFAKISNVERLDASQTTGIAIAGMAIIYVIFWLYYNKAGKLV